MNGGLLESLGLDQATPLTGAVAGGGSGALLAVILEMLMRQRWQGLRQSPLLTLAALGGVGGAGIGAGVGGHMLSQRRMLEGE